MKKLSLVPAAVLFMILIMAGTSTAQLDQRQRRDRIHDKLNLTAEQETKIQKLRIEHQKKMIELKADLEKAKVDARETRTNDNISRSDVVNNIERINKIKNEIALSAANHRMDVYEILTPEQREIWQKEEGPRMDGRGRQGDGQFQKKDGMRLNRHKIW